MDVIDIRPRLARLTIAQEERADTALVAAAAQEAAATAARFDALVADQPHAAPSLAWHTLLELAVVRLVDRGASKHCMHSAVDIILEDRGDVASQ